MARVQPPAADILASLRAGSPLDRDEQAALADLASRFGIRIESTALTGQIEVHGDAPSLDALNETLWSSGEEQGDYLEYRHLACVGARAALALLGEGHLTTLSALHNHANCLEAAGRLREARDIFLHVLGGRRAAAGVDDPATLITQNDLGLVLHALGDATQARQLHEDALARRRRALGDTHPQTLSSMNNLAVALRTLGEMGEATRLVRHVLAARLERQGEDHRDTMMAFNNLAACLVEAGEIDEARSLLARAWRGFGRILGNSHRDTLTALHNLAWCHQALGETRVARGLYEQLIDRCRQALGEKHPDTLTSEHNLARFLAEQGEYDQARAIVQRVYLVQRDVLGPRHEDTLRTREQLVAEAKRSASRDFVRVAVDFLGAVAEAPSHTGSWPGLAAAAGAHLVSPGDGLPDVQTLMSTLSRGLLEAYDLAPSDKRQRIAHDFMAFHRSWLAVCLASDTTAVPEALSAIHGREINALLMGNWTSQSHDLGAEDPRPRFLETRRQIIDLRVQLEWLGESFQGGGLSERHDRLIADYRRRRAELARSHPGFYAAEAPVITEADLRRRLAPDECVVLLFGLAADPGTEPAGHWAVCVTGEASLAMPLPKLADCVRMYRDSESSCQTDTAALRLIVGAQSEDGAEGAEPVDATRWTRAVRGAVWDPLSDALPREVKTVHLVTHDHLHPLPLEHGHPTGVRTFVYPGVVFLAHRLAARGDGGAPAKVSATVPPRTRDATPAVVVGRIAVHTDTGSGALGIPFARADASLLTALAHRFAVPVPVLSAGRHTAPRWQAGATAFDVWHFACHGREVTGPVRQTALALDDDTWLDATAVLASGQRPKLVVLGACVVGRVKDSPTGEPLGLISGLWLAGAEFIVAPVQPVPDFWMPLLTVLFYHSLLDGMGPADALDDAKRRLRAGNWPEGVAEMVHEAYRDAIVTWLPSAASDADLAGVMTGWHLPPDLANRLETQGAPALVAALAADDRAAEAFVRRLSGHLIDQRSALPRHPLDHLTLWVRGFGMPTDM